MPNSQNPRDIDITITVDTETLWNKPYPNTTEADIDACTSLSDGLLSSPFGSPSKEFESEVYRRKKVTWSICKLYVTSTKEPELVSVHQSTQNNTLYFNQNPLNVRRDGTVQGVVLNLDNLPDDTYTINIKVINGNEERTYSIDPKLKISVRQ